MEIKPNKNSYSPYISFGMHRVMRNQIGHIVGDVKTLHRMSKVRYSVVPVGTDHQDHLLTALTDKLPRRTQHTYRVENHGNNTFLSKISYEKVRPTRATEKVEPIRVTILDGTTGQHISTNTQSRANLTNQDYRETKRLIAFANPAAGVVTLTPEGRKAMAKIQNAPRMVRPGHKHALPLPKKKIQT